MIKFPDRISWEYTKEWKLVISNCVISNSRTRAFTLIELLVVISIIGILISISVVGWVSVAQRGRDSARKSDLARIKQVLQQQYSDTRAYPAFDASKGLIYAAGWQLTTDSQDIRCKHSNASIRLTTRYIAEVPRDPQDGTDYNQECGIGLTENQGNRYIYITPTDSSGPINNPSSFALMATLEQSQAEYVLPSANPLDPGYTYTGSIFGNWYVTGRNNYDSPISVNANYLVDNKNQ